MTNTIKKKNPDIVLELVVLIYGIFMPLICAVLLYVETYKIVTLGIIFSSWFIAGIYIGSKGGIKIER